MKYVEGLTIEELSEEFHINKSAVKMRLLRARHHVLGMYNEHIAMA